MISKRTAPDMALRDRVMQELHQIEEDGAFAGLGARDLKTDPRDARRITDLVSGTTRHRRYLDFLVDSFYSGSPETLEIGLRRLLRAALYELLFTRAAVHAVVSEWVETTRRTVGKRGTGLVNGILRSADRKRDRLPEPSTGNVVADLAIRYSHPDWMVRRWLERYGEEDCVRFLEFNNSRPYYGVRVRRTTEMDQALAATEGGIDAHESATVPGMLRTRDIQPLLRSGVLKAGHAVIQDEAAAGVVLVPDPRPGDRILDLCSAPGGKSFFIADLMENEGEVVAADIHENRLRLVSSGAEALGISIIQTRCIDGVKVGSEYESGYFDAVLVDAPCTGLGVLSKRADSRWRKEEKDLEQLAALQLELLIGTAPLVRAGGALVYSTCTTEPEENEEVVRRFLERCPEFVLETPEIGSKDRQDGDDRFYRTLPFRDHVDGAFAARMIRSSRTSLEHGLTGEGSDSPIAKP